MLTARNLDNDAAIRFRTLAGLLTRVAGKKPHYVVTHAPVFARPGMVAIAVRRGNGDYVGTLSVPTRAFVTPR